MEVMYEYNPILIVLRPKLTMHPDFHNPQSSLKGIIGAAYSLGAILSLPFIPMLDNKVGRRGSILVGSAIMVIGSIIQGLSINVTMYIFARLILGFGIPACIVAGSALIGELGYPKERPILTSLFNVSYFVGQLVAAGIVFGTNNIPGSKYKEDFKRPHSMLF